MLLFYSYDCQILKILLSSCFHRRPETWALNQLIMLPNLLIESKAQVTIRILYTLLFKIASWKWLFKTNNVGSGDKETEQWLGARNQEQFWSFLVFLLSASSQGLLASLLAVFGRICLPQCSEGCTTCQFHQVSFTPYLTPYYTLFSTKNTNKK